MMLTADTEVCLNALSGTISIPFNVASYVDHEVLSEDPLLEIDLITTPWGSNYLRLTKTGDEEYAHLRPSDLLKLVMKREASDDTITIELRTDEFIYENEDPDLPFIPVTSSNGTIIFQDPVSTYVSNADYDEITFYPNPAGKEVLLDDDEWRGARVVVFDVQGRFLRESFLMDQIIDLRELTAGTYFVRLLKDGKYGWGRVVKR